MINQNVIFFESNKASARYAAIAEKKKSTQRLLKKENLDYLEEFFVDLLTIVKDKKCCTKLFNKGDSFLFIMVRMSYLDNNTPSRIFYSGYGAEMLRSARITNYAAIIQTNFKILINRMIKQGERMKRLFTFGFYVFHK